MIFRQNTNSKFYPLITMIFGIISFLISGIITEAIRSVSGENSIIQGLGPLVTLPITVGIGLLILGLFLHMGKKIFKMVIISFIGLPICHILIGIVMFAFFTWTGNWGNFLYVLFMNIIFGTIFGTLIYGRKSSGLFFIVCGIIAIPYGLFSMYMTLMLQENLLKIFAVLNPVNLAIGTGIGLSMGLYSYQRFKKERPT